VITHTDFPSGQLAVDPALHVTSAYAVANAPPILAAPVTATLLTVIAPAALRVPAMAVLPLEAVTTNLSVATFKSEVTSSVDPTVAAPLVPKVVDATYPITVITPDARPIRSVSPLTPMLAPVIRTDSTYTYCPLEMASPPLVPV